MAHWTNELLDLMVEKLLERKKATVEAMEHGSSAKAGKRTERNAVVTDEQLFNSLGGKLRRVKHGN